MVTNKERGTLVVCQVSLDIIAMLCLHDNPLKR